MPNRSRSHQLEDASIIHFKSKLPEAWVCREKDSDYGVDLEVEIFDELGNATGLMFYVQLKATDDQTKECKVSIPVDRIRYLQSFDVPSIIVRYCSVTKNLFWCWTFGLLNRLNEDNASITVLFTSPWNNETPDHVLNVIRKIRRLKAANRNEKFPISVVQQLPAAKALKCRAALATVLSELTLFSLEPGDPTALELAVTFSESTIRIALEPIGFLEIDSAAHTEADFISLLTYGFTSVLTQMGFADQAITAARACLKLGQCEDNFPRELGYIACLSLQTDPIAAVRLAILNRFHHPVEGYHAAFLTSLLSWPEKHQDWNDAVELFYQAALDFVKERGGDSGSLLYSLGNFRSNAGHFAMAVSAYNAARKARAKYLESAYFLKELGGLLFLSGHYKCAANAYQAALALGYEKQTAFCLGDALLLAGEYQAAIETFEAIKLNVSDSFAAETRLKLHLASWLTTIHLIDRPTEIQKILTLAEEARSQGAITDFFWGCLLASFVIRSNDELWSLTISLALTVASREEVIDVMTCAEEARGLRPYNNFRSAFSESLDDAVLVELDELSLEIHSVVQSRPKHPMTARLLYEDRTEVFIQG